MRRNVLACALGILVIAGCDSETSSSSLATNAIIADLSAVDGSGHVSGLYCVAKLTSDSSVVRLEGGDTIGAATEQDPETELSWDGVSQHYRVNIAGTGRAHATFKLTRPNAVSAPSSTADIPPVVALTAPTSTQTISYATGNLDVSWSNPVDGATMFFMAQPCNGGSVTTESPPTGPDTGQFSVPMSDLLLSAPPAQGSCVYLIIQRLASGTPDPAFAPGSTIRGGREEWVQLTITP
jgi:hypothetical protein